MKYKLKKNTQRIQTHRITYEHYVDERYTETHFRTHTIE